MTRDEMITRLRKLSLSALDSEQPNLQQVEDAIFHLEMLRLLLKDQPEQTLIQEPDDLPEGTPMRFTTRSPGEERDDRLEDDEDGQPVRLDDGSWRSTT